MTEEQLEQELMAILMSFVGKPNTKKTRNRVTKAIKAFTIANIEHIELIEAILKKEPHEKR